MFPARRAAGHGPTPYRDKKCGTIWRMAVVEKHRVAPDIVVIADGAEETVERMLGRGCRVAFSIYPGTKTGNERPGDLVRRHGSDRIICDPACERDISDP